MTVAEAKKILTPPLIFGDEKQSAALQFLEKVAEAREAREKGDHSFYYFADDVQEAARRG